MQAFTCSTFRIVVTLHMNNTIPINGFLKGKQVEQLVQCCDETVHSLRRSGVIKAIKLSNRTYRYPIDQPFFKQHLQPSTHPAVDNPIPFTQPSPATDEPVVNRVRRRSRRLKDIVK